MLATGASDRGFKGIIARAGTAAHLPGVVAAGTTPPVIAVPLATSDLSGRDAPLAIMQMPDGIPVATMAVGKVGARNAGFLATQIVGLSESQFQVPYQRYCNEQAEKLRAESSL